MNEAERGRTAGDGITALGHEVYEIDTRMAGYDKITAGYLIRAERPCLVETGTAPSAPVVAGALTRLGIGPADLATVVVTHIHLDHAGGVGDIAAMYPAAEIVVHQKGARHLADPSRLMDSARRVYGKALDRLFGVLAPTPAERIRAVEERGSIDLGGGRRLDSHYSPGHAKHHVGLIDSDSGDLYVGDAAGVFIQETGDLRPATPPPDFDLPLALDSLRTFAALAPQRLLFSHFGPVRRCRDPGTLGRGTERLGRPDPPGPRCRAGPRPCGRHGHRTDPAALCGARAGCGPGDRRKVRAHQQHRCQCRRHPALAGADRARGGVNHAAAPGR